VRDTAHIYQLYFANHHLSTYYIKLLYVNLWN
jgi:hypothetical protein